MKGQDIGYIRVRTVGQNFGRQRDGMGLDKVFEDKANENAINRPGWNRCKEFLNDGETFTYTALTALPVMLKAYSVQSGNRQAEKGVPIRFVKKAIIFFKEK